MNMLFLLTRVYPGRIDQLSDRSLPSIRVLRLKLSRIGRIRVKESDFWVLIMYCQNNEFAPLKLVFTRRHARSQLEKLFTTYFCKIVGKTRLKL